MSTPEEHALWLGTAGNPCPACGERILHPSQAELEAELERLRAENDRLRSWLDPIMEAYDDFEDFAFTSQSASMEIALRRAFVAWHDAYGTSNE